MGKEGGSEGILEGSHNYFMERLDEFSYCT